MKLPIANLIRYAREHSPFYRNLYNNLPEEVQELEQLPVVDQGEFWLANSYCGNRLLTGAIHDGIILRSGGTTGKPKFSVFTREEWNCFTGVFARNLAHNGLVRGDRVANLFYSGELYGSFLFTHRVLEECPVPLLQLPITGNASLPETIRLIQEYEATVIAALPTTLVALVEKMDPGLYGHLKVRTILFAGEPMQRRQRELMLRAFPGAAIRSIGYASNDAALLGYVDLGCAPNEFRCFDGHAVYEIVDEFSGQPIRECGREGLAVVTALERRLMPVLRYPVGDRAQWVDPEGTPNRKYLLLGRSEEAARIASLSVGLGEVQSFLDPLLAPLGSFQFQLIVVHRDGHDGLVVRISTAVAQEARAELEAALIEAIYLGKAILRTFVAQGKVLPVRVEWRAPGELETNPRSGKLRRVIDLRAQGG